MNPEVQVLTDTAGSDRAWRVSVVVPAYERVGPLRALLDSLLEQRLSVGAFEVIVANDGSGPELADAVRSYAAAFERLVLVTAPNAGPGIARNRGARVARSEILTFIDSDCLATPGWLDHLAAAVENGSGMAHGSVRSSVPRMEPFIHSFQLEGPGTPTGIFAIRRTLFERLGGFDPKLSRAGEDHAFFARAKAAGILPDFVADASVLHPPRLKRVAIRGVAGSDQLDWGETVRAVCGLAPEWRARYAGENRRLLLKAAVKAGLLFVPFVLPFGRPWIWTSGFALLFTLAFGKWLRANRALAAAKEPIRVPFGDAVRYALLFAFADALALLERARYRILFFK